MVKFFCFKLRTNSLLKMIKVYLKKKDNFWVHIVIVFNGNNTYILSVTVSNN